MARPGSTTVIARGLLVGTVATLARPSVELGWAPGLHRYSCWAAGSEELHERPLLLDPVHPDNNLMRGVVLLEIAGFAQHGPSTC